MIETGAASFAMTMSVHATRPHERSARGTLEALVAEIDRHGPLAIAVSGGVDSMTLAHVAQRHARQRPRMVHATGPAVPAAARARVEAHAARHDWSLVLIDAGELADGRYRANPMDRCYYCKTNLYARMGSVTEATIASGTNRDDLADFRPGLRAATERGVVHPYVDAGLGKDAIYALAALLGLADLEALPAQPCLASRVETGIAIAAEDLAFIDGVETAVACEVGADRGLRCRLTRAGVVIELAAADDAVAVAKARAVAAAACLAAGRPFAGVRRYRRGAAFVPLARR